MKSKICATKGCGNKTRDYNSLCETCRSREKRKKNPVGYFFNLLRCNAKRRGIEFVLTVDEFRDFCREVDYIKNKGTKTTSLTIDRIDPTKGYRIDNIQAIPKSLNCKKVVYDHYAQRKFSVQRVGDGWNKAPPYPDVPF
jgi:hypothetical protein